MSLLKTLKQDTSNAFSDAYASLVLGDDAGKSARFAWIAAPSAQGLGLTFLEVNGRPYVESVEPGSVAAEAGLLERDAIQFATAVSSASAIFKGRAKEHALECEAQGMRITYEELRLLLREGGFDPNQTAFLSTTENMKNETNNRQLSTLGGNQSRIPSTIRICLPTHKKHLTTTLEDEDEDMSQDSDNNTRGMPLQLQDTFAVAAANGLSLQKPVVFVVRRTRQRPNTLWNFRLDDECDFASSLIRRLAPTADMDMPSPDTWEELVHDGTDWLLGSGSILPPKEIHPPSERVTLANAATIASNNTSLDEGQSIPLDDYEQDRAAKLAHLRSRMAAETLLHERADDVEAATLRGMVQKAVGLAFVRASKVVLGVSVHGGSGIVIARLPDGTWSAPSAIGTWGLGLGLQFGLEVAEYIFILQTQESLEHFRRGHSFTIGGNVGAAVAGMGREAYGAASVGACFAMPGSRPMSPSTVVRREDEYDDNDSDPDRLPPHPSQQNFNHNSCSNEVMSSNFGIAPIVAYAKSQGLYIGVSLEGSRIFTRNDLNARAYKFTTGGAEVTASDILSGKVSTPPEAEDLYATLHSVEFTHEMALLPRPPEVLRQDSANAWYYDKSTLPTSGNNTNSSGRNERKNNRNSSSNADPFSFLKDLSREEVEECAEFETQFKKFMYGGVSVQRLLPQNEYSSQRHKNSKKNSTGKERRTLWLMLPEVGALRLGFVSKLSDNDIVGSSVSNKSSTQKANREQSTENYLHHSYMVNPPNNNNITDVGTVASEELTLDSTFQELKDNNTLPTSSNSIHAHGTVQLSSKHSVALTDVTLLSQEPNVPVRFNPEDQTEHLRVISIQDVSGTSLLFLANNFREAELLVCGLKLLLEQETARLGVRGGLPISALGGKAGEGAMSPTAARGFKENHFSSMSVFSSPRSTASATSLRQQQLHSSPSSRRNNSRNDSILNSGYSSSECNDDMSFTLNHYPYSSRGTGTVGSNGSGADLLLLTGRHASLPEGRKNWGEMPSRDYLRGQAGQGGGGGGLPNYVHGQVLVREIATDVQLPLPLPLCRVLLLDSSSPVIGQWESDRGDNNFSKSDWTFPLATPRELENHDSEHQLIASGSMMGAHRTTTFDRVRNGNFLRLSETQIIDSDDSEKLAFTVSERSPRRGFSIKVRIQLRASQENSCEASVLGEIRPVGKNMSNQAAVHKAFLLVLKEIKERYGTEGGGLMAGFLAVVNSLPKSEIRQTTKSSSPILTSSSQRSSPTTKATTKDVSFSPFPRTEPPSNQSRSSSRSDMSSEGASHGGGGSSVNSSSHFQSGLVSLDDMINKERTASAQQQQQASVRSPTPILARNSTPDTNRVSKKQQRDVTILKDEQPPLVMDQSQSKTIEVKPLPKIRLSLMPSPREEDEEKVDDDEDNEAILKRKKKRRSSRRRYYATEADPDDPATKDLEKEDLFEL